MFVLVAARKRSMSREEERAVGPSCRNFHILEKEIRAMLSTEQCHHHLDFPKTEKVKCEMNFLFIFRKEQKESLKKEDISLIGVTCSG